MSWQPSTTNNLETFRDSSKNKQSYWVTAQTTERRTTRGEILIPTIVVWGTLNTMDGQHAAAASAESEATDAIATVHKLKLKPPTYDGNYATFDEWKYKFTAYMGIQDPTYPTLMEKADNISTQWDLKGADNYVSGSQHHWEQEAVATEAFEANI